MNATQRHDPTAGDTAVAEPSSEAGNSPNAAATADTAAAEGMDRDDWLCRVGDVARLLREQRRASEAEGHRTAEDRG
jgi:hypothetical protein